MGNSNCCCENSSVNRFSETIFTYKKTGPICELENEAETLNSSVNQSEAKSHSPRKSQEIEAFLEEAAEAVIEPSGNFLKRKQKPPLKPNRPKTNAAKAKDPQTQSRKISTTDKAEEFEVQMKGKVKLVVFN